jgi:hypothetical protein
MNGQKNPRGYGGDNMKEYDYPEIRKWGKKMGSFPYYIEQQVRQARKDKAPQNATYKSDGKWATTDDIKEYKEIDYKGKLIALLQGLDCRNIEMFLRKSNEELKDFGERITKLAEIGLKIDTQKRLSVKEMYETI